MFMCFCGHDSNRAHKKPEWSHDGSRFFVVFTNQPGKPRDGEAVKSLLLADADGSNLRHLTEFGIAPMWGPDDAFVYTVDRQSDGLNAIVAHPVDGSASYPIVSLPLGRHSTLSLDGEHVVTDVFDWPEPGRGAILLYDVSTGDHTELARFGMPDTSHVTGVHAHPALSRDGKRVYFSVGEQNEPHLYAIEL